MGDVESCTLRIYRKARAKEIILPPTSEILAVLQMEIDKKSVREYGAWREPLLPSFYGYTYMRHGK